MHFYDFNAFYTPCRLILNHGLKSVCDSVAHLIFEYSKKLEQKYSFFSDSSFLNQINFRKSNKISIDTQTDSILKDVLFLMQKTDYVFDIAYSGTLKECYCFKTIQEMRAKKDELLPYASHECFCIKNNKLIFNNNFTKLDLGGIIKEYAVDGAAKIVEQHKITSALINFGGDIKAIGLKNGENWRVGIKNPKNPDEDLTIVEINNTALTTSGHYERKYTVDGSNFSFIMQKPNTHSGFLQATVIHNSAMTAGVFSTAFLINEQILPLKNMKTILVNEDLSIKNI